MFLKFHLRATVVLVDNPPTSPSLAAVSNEDLTSALTDGTVQVKHRQLTGSLAALVVDLILNICYQHTNIIKSLAFSPTFSQLLTTILDDNDEADESLGTQTEDQSKTTTQHALSKTFSSQPPHVSRYYE